MTDFKPGIYEDLDYPTYASITVDGQQAWRSHDLTSLIKCAYSWKNAKPMTESPALLEGRVQHTVFLEHHKFFDEFAIEPEHINRRTKAGKEEYEDWMSSLGNKTPCKQDLYDLCMERRAALEEFIPSPDDKVELTLVFEWCGQPCKGKLDWYTGTDIWDLKTCRDASPRGFKNAVNSFRYYQQAAFYMAAAEYLGIQCDKFYFLAQEKAYPYPYGVYTLTQEAIEYGHAKNQQALEIGLKCRETGDYKPFNNGLITEFNLADLW